VSVVVAHVLTIAVRLNLFFNDCQGLKTIDNV
jgi:hypothetical protein